MKVLHSIPFHFSLPLIIQNTNPRFIPLFLTHSLVCLGLFLALGFFFFLLLYACVPIHSDFVSFCRKPFIHFFLCSSKQAHKGAQHALPPPPPPPPQPVSTSSSRARRLFCRENLKNRCHVFHLFPLLPAFSFTLSLLCGRSYMYINKRKAEKRKKGENFKYFKMYFESGRRDQRNDSLSDIHSVFCMIVSYDNM